MDKNLVRRTCNIVNVLLSGIEVRLGGNIFKYMGAGEIVDQDPKTGNGISAGTPGLFIKLSRMVWVPTEQRYVPTGHTWVRSDIPLSTLVSYVNTLSYEDYIGILKEAIKERALS